MKQFVHRYPYYGTVGLVILLLMQTALLCAHSDSLSDFPWWMITAWATPACWWGYILAVDAWIYRCEGTSMLTARRDIFVLQCILSVAFWCVFEAYNRLMLGWHYVNLTEDLPTRFAGYAVSFATIMPGMFLTCALFQSYNAFAHARMPQIGWSRAPLNVFVLLGTAFCALPPFAPEQWRGHLWAFVWMGPFFLLEPFNYRRGMPSIFRDWERGDLSRTLQLFAAGAFCGLLWEFWNMWAYTKWVYIFPVGHAPKYFEMPLAGFLGFLPFALDYFAMFHFIASFFTREDRLGI